MQVKKGLFERGSEGSEVFKGSKGEALRSAGLLLAGSQTASLVSLLAVKLLGGVSGVSVSVLGFFWPTVLAVGVGVGLGITWAVGVFRDGLRLRTSGGSVSSANTHAEGETTD